MTAGALLVGFLVSPLSAAGKARDGQKCLFLGSTAETVHQHLESNKVIDERCGQSPRFCVGGPTLDSPPCGRPWAPVPRP